MCAANAASLTQRSTAGPWIWSGGEVAGTSDVDVVGLSGQQGHEHGVDFGVGVDAVGEECQIAKKGTCGDADGVRVTVGGDLHVVGR